MYSFFRFKGSLDRCIWLAISIKGRSHVVSTTKDADKGSEKKVVEKFMLL